ncbi:CxC2 domain-containing protein [Mycena kentingensis (nom. inval.)]|nr:CxC2 domain-containing protein [Mycena kentingensis (nom. inval.)]
MKKRGNRLVAQSGRTSFQFDASVPDASADQGYHFRRDGRAVARTSNVAPKKRVVVEEAAPEASVDALDSAYHPQDPEFAHIASTLSSNNDTYEHFIEESEVTKRKRYVSSDDPMRLWRDQKHTFLDNLVRRGRPRGVLRESVLPSLRWAVWRWINDTSLPLRGVRAVPPVPQLPSKTTRGQASAPDKGAPSLFSPSGTDLGAQEWTGDNWTEAALHKLHIGDDSTRSLGFEYQLGHHGKECVRPGPLQTMVVIDVSGVHTLQIRFCGCEKSLRQDRVAQLMGNTWYPATTIDPATCATYAALDQFRLLNAVGNISVHDYVGTLERITEPTGLEKVPDRYVAFGRMSRQYAFLHRAKRAGLAHDGEQMQTIQPGGLAVRCWACPYEGFNLPEGWDKCSEDDKFLYALMLAIDANFRLKNRIRTNEKNDPSLGPGWGCFVESEAYKDHLRDYVAETDISTCIAFAALMEKNTKLTTGLRVSGVGGCVCARHGVVRAQGLGDLQKGERYANMDYILLHALRDARVRRLVLSYDIACQWKVRLRARVAQITEEAGLLPDLSNFEIQFALPVWHAAAHETGCQAAMSLSHKKGVGRTDGEGIERTWAVLNPISFATKEMGEGNRHDTIEDKVDRIGFEKNVGEGDTLARKIVIATAERNAQIAEFIEIDRGIDGELRREWQQMIEDWLEDESKPNPYVMAAGKDAGPSEAEVAAELKRAEVEEMRAGRGEAEGKTTATGFIKGLLQLEDMKRRIKHEIRGKTLTAERTSQIEELRASFFKKLAHIQHEQDVFMPGVARLRAAAEENRDADIPPPKAEDVKLWLPSELTASQRQWACRPSLVEVEAKLREAQCGDALTKVRGILYTITHLIHTRNTTSVGQAPSTRSSTLISRVGDRRDREVSKYNGAWKALRALKGPEYAAHFRELTAADLRGLVEADGGQAVRVHWCKAKARRDRWVEEVRLLKEERRRVLRSLWAVQEEWRARIGRRRAAEPWLAAGLAAYARRQVEVHARIARRFYDGWHVTAKPALAGVLGEDREVHARLLVGEWDVVGAGATVEGSVAELEM